jgi:hypothetical protein
MMETGCILIGNEPLTYREVIAAALRELRPPARITIVDSDGLDAEVIDKHPALVICSHLTPEIRAGAASWLLLYPDGDGRSVFSSGNQEHEIPSVDFASLLAFVDLAMAPRSPA